MFTRECHKGVTITSVHTASDTGNTHENQIYLGGFTWKLTCAASVMFLIKYHKSMMMKGR